MVAFPRAASLGRSSSMHGSPNRLGSGTGLGSRMRSPLDPIQDAEASVGLLCRKFQELSEHLCHEEEGREQAERRATLLAEEVRSAESPSGSHPPTPLSEGRQGKAARESDRLEEEAARSADMERTCSKLLEEYHAEAVQADRLLALAAAQNCDSVDDYGAHAELARLLRHAEADARVAMEDLRIAQGRATLSRDKQRALELDLEIACRACRSSKQQVEQHTCQLAERKIQLQELESRLQEVMNLVEVVHGETMRMDRDVDVWKDEDQDFQKSMEVLKQELQGELQDQASWRMELGQCERQAAPLLAEVQALEASEAFVQQQHLREAEATLTAARHRRDQWSTCEEAFAHRLQDLNAEDVQNRMVAKGLRQAWQDEDVVFMKVQGDLQAAFRDKAVLDEELSKQLRARDLLAVQLRKVRPEIEEVDASCKRLQSSLSAGTREGHGAETGVHGAAFRSPWP